MPPKRGPPVSSNSEDHKRQTRSKAKTQAKQDTPVGQDTPVEEPQVKEPQGEEAQILQVVMGSAPKDAPGRLHNIAGDRVFIPNNETGGWYGYLTGKQQTDLEHSINQLRKELNKFHADANKNREEQSAKSNTMTVKETQKTNNVEKRSLKEGHLVPKQNEVADMDAKILKHDSDGPFANHAVEGLSKETRTELINSHNQAREDMENIQKKLHEGLSIHIEEIATHTRVIGELNWEIPELARQIELLDLERRQLFACSARIVATMRKLANHSIDVVCGSMGMDVDSSKGAAQGVKPAIGPP